MKELIPPVFCDNCPLLALAMLDGAPVCGECLAAAVEREGAEGLRGRIEPLRLKKPFWWRWWCCPEATDAPARAGFLDRAG